MKYSDEEIIGQRSGRSISPQFELECQEIICLSLVELMTEKGIYQNINLNYASALRFGIDKILKKENEFSYDDLAYEFNHRPWQPISKGLGSDFSHKLPGGGSGKPLFTKDEDLDLCFHIPEIITYCNECKKDTSHLSMASSGRNFIESIECIQDNFIEQYFVFHYKCGLCRKTIINFLITRYKNKITLCGRSERLNFDIDKIIPKKFRQIVCDALSAANESDVFAGFYHLRTFIEHFVKDILKIEIESQIRGDELIDNYNKEVGSKIVGRTPSFTTIYSDLSKYMHSRTGDKKDFDSQLEKIIDHLRAKDLFDKYSKNT